MSHEILRVFVRPGSSTPPEERAEIELVADHGVAGDHGISGKRHVTIVLREDWREAEAELGIDVDPIARRANVLLSGGGGTSLIGKRLRVGPALLDVQGEVAPCRTMERGAVGLMEALQPNSRAGVWALVVTGGTLRPGDAVEILPAG